MKKNNRDFYKFLGKFTRPYSKELFLGSFIVMLINSIEMIPPYIFKIIGDNFETGKKSFEVTTLVMIFVICYTIMAMSRYLWRYYFIVTSRQLECDLKRYYFSKVLNTRYALASKLKVGDTVSILSQDVDAIRMFVGVGGIVISDMISYLILVPLVLVSVVGPIGLMVMIPFVIIPVAMSYYESQTNILFEKNSTYLGKIADKVYEESIGVKVLKTLNLYFQRREKFGEILNQLYESKKRTGMFEIFLEASIDILIFCSRVILFLCAYAAISGNVAIFKDFYTMGAIVIVMKSLDRLIWPLMAFSYMATLTQNAKASFERLNKLEQLPYFLEGTKVLNSDFREYKVEGLFYSYPGNDTSVLKDLNFEFNASQKIGIVGDVGAGKSSLLKILCGLYPVSDIDSYSKIEVNNISFESLNFSSLQRKVSYLPQESLIFNASVRKNIAPGRHLSDEEAYKYLELACLVEDVQSLPDGLETPVGEKGINLSGGQKQRLSIARSLASGAEIYLWDDTISALDVITEKKVINNLYHLNKRASLILATHRPSALKNFDCIYVMEAGKIVEKGAFKELMNNEGKFYSLYQYEQKTRNLRGEV